MDRYKYNEKHFFKKISKRKMTKNNEKYVFSVLRLNKDFFDNINGICLDYEQRRIIASEEDSALVVAGAGSGKSLTIVGRIMYLVKNGVNPSDILVISFTNEASLSLKKKLYENGIDMDIMTFHKLGRKILKENGYPVSLVSMEALDDVIDKRFCDCLDLDKLFPDMRFITIGYEDMSDVQREIMLLSNEVKGLKKLMHTFINLFKGNNYNVDDFDRFLRENEKENGYFCDKHRLFLNLARDIYLDYEYYLEKNKQIDFHDMINKSASVILEKGIYGYKYLIIDEYQDTSLAKCRLLQAIKKVCGCRVLAVGDDFQSIYRFTGTNLKVFTDFDKYFPNSALFKLEKVYRNSMELLDITSRFILKNKNQISKKLYSSKSSFNPIYVCYYEDNFMEVLDKIVNEIDSDDLLILGRNNKDLEGISYRCMTMHKSKGLEADNVIIAGLEDKIDGFPSKIVNDKVLKYVIDEEDSILYEEERRLFYVALTRTRNSNYLLVNKNKPSIFVEELMRDNDNIEILEL